jgi:hypothetical protein
MVEQTASCSSDYCGKEINLLFIYEFVVNTKIPGVQIRVFFATKPFFVVFFQKRACKALFWGLVSSLHSMFFVFLL